MYSHGGHDSGHREPTQGLMNALLKVVSAAATAVLAAKVAANTENLIARGGTLAGKALAVGKRRLADVRKERGR